MRYADTPEARHVEATIHTRKQHGTCPGCKNGVYGHAGPDPRIRPYWRHLSLADCDPWYEKFTSPGMGEWHRGWQDWAPVDSREVVMGGHRADIVRKAKRPGEVDTVVEIQCSGISIDDVRARQEHYGQYGDMVWLFDARDKALTVTQLSDQKPGRVTYRWLWARQALIAANARSVYLDIGSPYLLFITRMHPPSGWGEGWIISHGRFGKWINGTGRWARPIISFEDGQAWGSSPLVRQEPHQKMGV